MAAQSKTQEKILKQELKVFLGNTINLEIDRLAGDMQDAGHKKHLKAAICAALGWGTLKLGRVLNNTDQPELHHLAAIAQILDVPTDRLIKLGPVAEMTVGAQELGNAA